MRRFLIATVATPGHRTRSVSASTIARASGHLARDGWAESLRTLRGRELSLALAALSVGASAIHFAVAPEHFTEYWVVGVFFVGLAWFQSIWAVFYPIFAFRGLGVLAILVNAGTVALWVWTRTVGVPIGPEAGRLEPIGAPDIAATAFELAIVVGLTWHTSGAGPALREHGTQSPALIGLLAAFLVLVMAVTALVLLQPSG